MNNLELWGSVLSLVISSASIVLSIATIRRLNSKGEA